MVEKLESILKSIGENVKGQQFTIKMNSNVFFEILNKKELEFTEFKEIIKHDWENFKLKNKERIIKKSYSTFFYNNFPRYFEHYLHHFCGLDKNSLSLLIKEKVSEENLFLEYNYQLSAKEEDNFKKFADNFKDSTNGIISPFGYFYLIVTILGVILRKILNEKLLVILDGAVIKNGQAKNSINFLIVIKNSNDEIFENYYLMFLYYFLRHFKDIPEEFYGKLLKGREKLYNLAKDAYPKSSEKLVDLLYYFYKKCNLLGNFSPLLDFLNFVCSRVEDSVFSKFDIIRRDFLNNFDYTEEKRNALIRLFDFLDKKATLYSTFQANNLPNEKSQFNLFLLHTKYYFGSGSLEALEVGDLLFLPDKFKEYLNFRNKKLENNINSNSIKEIQMFLNFFSTLTNIENPNLIFEKIFGKDINQLNYDFFKTFLRSLNIKISQLIESENAILEESPNNEPLTFKILVDHICRMLYTLIDKIFIRKRPDQASKNFIDPRSRYIGRNIALRVLELFIFQDLNLSDDLWPDYIITLNKDNLLHDLQPYDIKIPDNSFYRYDDIVRFVVTYNFQSYSDQRIFEEWIIDSIILPINNFILRIHEIVKDNKNNIEIYEKLSSIMLEGVEDEQIIKEIKFVCQEMAPFWEKKRN